MNDWTSSYLPISHHVNLWAFRQGTTTILNASNTCRIRGHERWRRRWCFRSAWMGKVRGGEEASGLTQGAGYLFRRRVRDSSSQRSIGDGWGVTGERIVFAVGGRPQPWIEGPRLHGLEVAPPWWCIRWCCYWKKIMGWFEARLFIFKWTTNGQTRSELSLSKHLIYLRWNNILNINIKVGFDSSKLLNW